MLFNSFHYALFLLAALFVVDAVRRKDAQQTFLLGASYYFYYAFSSYYVLLIVLSTLIDFACGRKIYEAQTRHAKRVFLGISLVSQLSLLAYFKYMNFAIDSARTVLGSLGMTLPGGHLDIVLPIGISFYTFMTLSYTLDIYFGRFEPVDSLRTFALYVTFFPHLVAGPILRAADFLPQLRHALRLTPDNVRLGASLIMCGLVKKTVVADNLAPFTRDVFREGMAGDWLTVWTAVVAFAIQIYCDFSGYTDIAIGSARLFGLRFPGNFNYPYFSPNIAEFWRRWHISLSTWLRDYLYIPLGGNRKGTIRQYVNLMVTMLLGGLWHGASWNFVLWGGYHGGLLAVHRMTVAERPVMQSAGWMPVKILFTFWLTCIGWLLFAVPDSTRLVSYLRLLFFVGSEPVGVADATYFFGEHPRVVPVLAGFALVHAASYALGGLAGRFAVLRGPAWAACAIAAAVFVALCAAGQPQSFIYFQF